MKTREKLEYADLISFEGKFELPSTQTNYGDFDYRKYLKTKGICGIVTTNKINVIAKRQLDVVSMFANDVREKILENIENVDAIVRGEKENRTKNAYSVNGNNNKFELTNSNMNVSECASVLSGILVGDKTNISDEIQTNFKDSGLSHLLAISGFHVNYVILFVTVLLNKLKIYKRTASGITILFIIFFMYLTNFTESVTRAGIMGIVALGSQILYRKNDSLTSIALSLLIILLENPYKLFSVGLQLSYGGTLGIVLFYPKIKFKLNNNIQKKNVSISTTTNFIVDKMLNICLKIKDILIVCISAQILILPIMLVNYNSFSSYFLLSNILVSPITGVIIVLGFVFILISLISIKLSIIVYIPIKWLLEALISINKFISNLPFATVLVKTPYWFNILFYYVVIIYLGFKSRFKSNKLVNYNRVLGICLVVLILFTFYLDYPNEFCLYFVDVAQGDCTLIRLKSNKFILVDGGGNEGYNVGENVLLPYLLNRRVSKIDYMVFSHFDTDHCGRIINNYGKTRCGKCNYW